MSSKSSVESPRPSKFRDWRIWLGTLYVLYLVGSVLAVPRLVTWRAEKDSRELLGRETSIREVSFNPFTLTITARGIEVRDPDGESFVAVDELEVNASVTGLFRFAAVADAIRVDGPTVRVRLMQDGSLSFQDLLDRQTEAADEEPPRFTVGLLEVTDGVFEFVDLTREPAYEVKFDDLKLALQHVSTIDQDKGAHEVTIQLGDATELHWSGSLVTKPLALNGRFELEGLSVPAVWEYFGEGHSFDLPEGVVHAAISYRIERTEAKEIVATFSDGSLGLTGLTLRDKESRENWLDVTSVNVNGVSARWPQSTVTVGSVVVDTVNMSAFLNEQGELNWAGLVPSRDAEMDEGGESPLPFSLAVESVELRQGSVRVADRRRKPVPEAAVSDVEATLTGLAMPEETPAHIALEAKVGEEGLIRAEGTVSVAATSADVQVEVSAVSLVEHMAWMPQLQLGELVSGSARMQGSVRFADRASPRLAFEGEAGLADVELLDNDGSRLLAVGDLAASGVGATVDPVKVKVRSVAAKNPFAKIRIDSNGVLNLTKVTFAAIEEKEKELKPVRDVPVTVDRIEIVDGQFDFADLSLIIPFAAEVIDGKGSILDVSTESDAGARVQVEGLVGEAGFAKVEGTLRPFDPFGATQLHVVFRNIDMSTLTPYSAEFAGYAIEGGSLDLDVRYSIANRILKGDHNVVARDMVLGERIERGGNIPVPLKLGLALLRDKDGKIDMIIPMEGPVDDPNFNYRQLAWAALKKILVNVATKPFSFIGEMIGISGDELEGVVFEAGESRLLPPEADQLSRLVAELVGRSEIRVEVVPVFDPLSDADAIRDTKLEESIERKRAELGEDATRDLVLESLFTDVKGAQELNAVRTRYLSTDAEGKETLDGAGLYAELRAALLAAETVERPELEDLAARRGQSVFAALTAEGGITASRIQVFPAEEADRKAAGGELVPSRLTLSVD